MRTRIIAGNWKMNLSIADAENLVKGIATGLKASALNKAIKVIVAPNYAYLPKVNECIPATQSAFFHLSAQNCAAYTKGAYTGEVSVEMLKNVGCDYVIIGHSERRAYFGEDESVLKTKVDLALEAGLKVIYCCGEMLEQREANQQEAIVKQQINGALSHLSNLDDVVIAYEPVWAIGTGVTASPEQAQEMHAFIRTLAKEKWGNETADKLTILYGGSCKPANASEIFAKQDVDGGLIGGASLKAEDFLAIIEAMNQSL